MNWVGEYIGNGEYPTWSLVPKRFSVGQWLEAHSMQNILTERYHLRQYRSPKRFMQSDWKNKEVFALQPKYYCVFQLIECVSAAAWKLWMMRPCLLVSFSAAWCENLMNNSERVRHSRGKWQETQPPGYLSSCLPGKNSTWLICTWAINPSKTLQNSRLFL